jgi:hypothetical protein
MRVEVYVGVWLCELEKDMRGVWWQTIDGWMDKEEWSRGRIRGAGEKARMRNG